MLSNYCETIRQKYGITIEQVQKLIPTLNNKEKYVLYYRNLQLSLGLGLKLTKIRRALEFYQSPWFKKNFWIKTENSSLVVYFVGFIKHQLLQSFVFSCFLDQTMESVYNTHRKFEGRFQEKKGALYMGKYGSWWSEGKKWQKWSRTTNSYTTISALVRTWCC